MKKAKEVYLLMKKTAVFLLLLTSMYLLSGCTYIKTYTEDEIVEYAKEYYGEATVYNGSEPGDTTNYREDCTDYHFTSDQGFEFTITAGVNKARKWVFFVFQTKFLQSTYMEDMIDFYSDDLEKAMEQSGLDVSWQQDYTEKYLKYKITDKNQIQTAAKMIDSMRNIMKDALPEKNEDIPVYFDQDIDIYGNHPLDSDEVTVYYGEFCDLGDLKSIQKCMEEQYEENCTNMGYK